MASLKILYVDDDQDDLDFFSFAFLNSKMEGEILSFTNPLEALETIKSCEPFELIFSDMKMPNMDGFKFIEELRKIEKCKNIPVILFAPPVYCKDNFEPNTKCVEKPDSISNWQELIVTMLKQEQA